MIILLAVESHGPPMKTTIPTMMPGAEPFFLPGGPVGCLCLHGITASPDEMRWFGEHLNGQGVTVYGPRIAGHGAHYTHLRTTRWQDWYLSALDGYHLLRQQCERVVVAGLSMGGLLSLLIAANEDVDRVIVMASPLKLTSERLIRMAPVIKLMRPFIHLPDRTDFPKRLQVERQARGETLDGRVRYTTWATQALQELYTLVGTVKTHLPQVTAPALLMYSTQDETVSYGNMALVQQGLGSTHIETETFTRSGHILTQDYDHKAVFDRAARFILAE